MADEPGSHKLRYGRRMEGVGTFFVTKALSPRKPILPEVGIAEEIVSTLRFSVKKRRILLAAFVVMPDHWHALFRVGDGMDLPVVMGRMDSWIGRVSFSLDPSIKWQESYYETRIKSNRQFRFVRAYIENNPVRKALAKGPEAWRWSSGNPEFQESVTNPWPYRFEEDGL